MVVTIFIDFSRIYTGRYRSAVSAEKRGCFSVSFTHR
jgi:hypothetical protein